MILQKYCLVLKINIPKLSEAERNSCEGLLPKKECWEALNEMKNSKSPGNNRLTKEFYMCFLMRFVIS